MHPLRAFVLVLAVAAILPVVGLANDASYQGFGATVYLAREARVRMVSETVDIRHQKDANDRMRSRKPYLVDATFRFRNLSDREVTVLMGHPDWHEQGDPGPGGHPLSWALADFQVWIDGVSVQPVHRDAIPPIETLGKRDLEAARHLRQGAWTWEVTFPPGGERIVRNTYRFGGLQTNGPYAACAGERPSRDARRAFWRRAGDLEDGWMFDGGFCATATYVTTSGRTWGGPIGDAVISMEVDPELPPHLFIPDPKATEVREGRVVWRFKDWTPRGELSIHSIHAVPGANASGMPAFDTVAQAKAWVKFAKANGFDRKTVLRVRAWTAAAREGRFDDPVLAASFLAPEDPSEEGVGRDPVRWERDTRAILDVLNRFAASLPED